jgi:hypothetical protein
MFSYGMQRSAAPRSIKRARKRKARWHLTNGLFVLATSYSRAAYRRTTIGAAAFHCRVRNGNGWCHCAIITRIKRRMFSPLNSGHCKFQIVDLQIASQCDAATGARSTSNFQRTRFQIINLQFKICNCRFSEIYIQVFGILPPVTAAATTSSEFYLKSFDLLCVPSSARARTTG